MLWRLSLLSSCLAIAGCGANSLAAGEDNNVTSSLQYDTVACKQLVAERNGLAGRYGLPTDAKPVFATTPTGFGVVLPDLRSSDQRAREKAAGEVDAMNRSLERRQCTKPPKAG